MLYNNPRGISCAKCHGFRAQGKIIAKYKIQKHNKTITKTIKAPNIQNISYEELKEKIFPKKRKLSILYTEYTDGGGFRFGKEFTFFLKKLVCLCYFLKYIIFKLCKRKPLSSQGFYKPFLLAHCLRFFIEI